MKYPLAVLFTGLWAFAALGFPQNPSLAGLADNTAMDLGGYAAQCADSSNDPDYCRRYGDYSRFTYDSDHHKILFFGGGHSTTMRDDIDVFYFSTLTWKSDYKSTLCSQMITVTTNGTWQSTGHPVARHTYDQLTYAPSAGRLIINSPVYGAGYCGTFGGCGEWCTGKVLAYDPVAKTWTPKGPAANGAHIWADEYDPVSGRIISAGRDGLRSYDPVSDVKATHLSSSPIAGYANNMVYYPPNDKFYYICRGTPTTVYEITLNRSSWNASTITQVTGMSGAPNSQESGWAYDTVNQVIGGGVLNGHFYAYDPPAKAWTDRTIQRLTGSGALEQYSHCIDYDPVDNVFIFYARDFHTWAYRYKAGGTAAQKPAVAVPGITLTAEPNPFASAVKVAVSGERRADGKIGIRFYNLTGKLVQKLSATSYQLTAGINWTAPDLPAGVYFIRARVGGKILQKKVVLQK